MVVAPNRVSQFCDLDGVVGDIVMGRFLKTFNPFGVGFLARRNLQSAKNYQG